MIIYPYAILAWGFCVGGSMNLKKYTRVKTHKTESLPFCTVHLVIKHQSFEINYAGSKREAEWFRGQLVKALEKLIKLEA